jgi:leader peptidase (prepilin peptidase)/N-methyltransferase
MNVPLDLAWMAAMLFSPVAGSVVGELVKRLPGGRPVALPRSQCGACGRIRSAANRVPIVNDVISKGRCRTCTAPIASFNIAIELSAVAVSVWAAMVDSDPFRLWADCVFGWMLLALAWIDWRHLRLPDALTLPLIAFSLAATALLTPAFVIESAVGAALGYSFFKGVALLHRVLRGHDGLGAGDAKLLAASGALVGWTGLPDVVLLAAMLGLGGVTLLHVSGRAFDRATAIPFGPYLAFATWIVRLHGPLVFSAVT